MTSNQQATLLNSSLFPPWLSYEQQHGQGFPMSAGFGWVSYWQNLAFFWTSFPDTTTWAWGCMGTLACSGKWRSSKRMETCTFVWLFLLKELMMAMPVADCNFFALNRSGAPPWQKTMKSTRGFPPEYASWFELNVTNPEKIFSLSFPSFQPSFLKSLRLSMGTSRRWLHTTWHLAQAHGAKWAFSQILASLWPEFGCTLVEQACKDDHCSVWNQSEPLQGKTHNHSIPNVFHLHLILPKHSSVLLVLVS